MTHTYQITGMTCSGCEAKVKHYLQLVPGITVDELSKDSSSAKVSMESHVSISTLQDALGGKESKYQISATSHNETIEETKSWFATYKPILLIFGYILAITLLAQLNNGEFDAMLAMRHFMAGFFLVFSFFKMLNIKGFAESYVMYDVVAQKFPAWAYLYAFIELALGIAFLIDFNPIVTNAVTLIVMSLSIIGVLRSVLNKRKIQCACLGAVFNLPMSTVTIIEDGLMIAMSAAMLLMLI
ncbi:MAG: heavy-metal-associated domain-containing protein [Flavobacterium sp.]|uniref:heavy-metal-associated domain-containing protein n=1 Tax=Flavobacterium sp. TaxID=239 RepID=UPI00120CA877|nr:heavy metal-associated domain-containing protein [Flavobacterium sp.]RZJ65617.1 MAG: heavy-metal-associated domain-containing protein [Flavobacterium sp.]